MKIEKNKIVFGTVLLCILVFIIAYTALIMGEEEDSDIDSNQIPLPELNNDQVIYMTKLDALKAIRKEKQVNAPSIYNDRLLDSLGVYDPNLLEKEKKQLIDSIYYNEHLIYEEHTYENIPMSSSEVVEYIPDAPAIDSVEVRNDNMVYAKEIALEQQLFFASHPVKNELNLIASTDDMIYVEIDGKQVIKANSRIRMRLMAAARINGKVIRRNTVVYGFISFKPNRALIEIQNINHRPTRLKAFDLADGSEGIYIENSFRAEATQKVITDMVDDINIAGVPQVSGFKSLFQRNRRTIKVTVNDRYRLILKVRNTNTKWY